MAGRMTLRSRTTSTGPAIQKVALAIPANPKQRRGVEAHLIIMGCEGLLNVAWRMHEEIMVMELLSVPDNSFYGTIWAHPEFWTIQHWLETYEFRTRFIKVAERNEDYLENMFIVTADPKDGYSLSDLRDLEA